MTDKQFPEKFIFGTVHNIDENFDRGKIVYKFKVENFGTQGRVLLTDQGTANILYIARITDTNLFDAMFVDVLTAKLAVDLAYPVTSSMAVQKQMQDLFQKKLSEARSIDGQEGFMDDLVSDTFTDFRK